MEHLGKRLIDFSRSLFVKLRSKLFDSLFMNFCYDWVPAYPAPGKSVLR